MMTLESRWNTLLPSPDTDVFQLYDPSHSLSFYIGRDIAGQRLLLLVTGQQPPASKEYKAIQFLSFHRPDDKWSLLFRLSSAELAPVFAIMCEDLIESTRNIPDPKRPVNFLMKRFANWQRLLERGYTGLLEESELRGLVGELVVLERFILPLLGPLETVGAWTGPSGADQDFQVVDRAWEVKTIRPDARAVRISSENQLSSGNRHIELLVVCLGDHTHPAQGIFTPNQLVQLIRGHLDADLDATDHFEQRLASAGYVVRPEYDTHYFSVRNLHRYRVDEGFPHISRHMLMPGISKVTYDLAIDACMPFIIEVDEQHGG